ncbi:DUF4198 domain-containing protein [Ideonella sp. BN130291]|uniref:DUF4198 domain-containing protein n=1 Tax=Ideonella sp. BN130291 TaxID=3112940 RepID=UPI002E25A916|nr:DUF4198 domain-containing protein [Ideonella sp. BN130291]
MLSCALSKTVATLALLGACAGAAAHDTWFLPLGAPSGVPLLSLGTGNRYPLQEFPIGAEQLTMRGCRSADDRPVSFSAVRDLPKSLLLQAAVAGAPRDRLAAPLSCWAQLVPFEVELEARIVDIYLDEIAASPAVREAWAGMRARGVTWKERFTKHARIELAAGRSTAAAAASGMGLDALLQSGLQRLREGDPLEVQVLRDGQPLAGLAVELIDARGASGGWFHTDAQGRVGFGAPAPGRWVLRGTDLRVSTTEPDTWDSRFINLAFEVNAKP